MMPPEHIANLGIIAESIQDMDIRKAMLECLKEITTLTAERDALLTAGKAGVEHANQPGRTEGWATAMHNAIQLARKAIAKIGVDSPD